MMGELGHNPYVLLEQWQRQLGTLPLDSFFLEDKECFSSVPCCLPLQGTELNDDRTPSNASVTTTFHILVIDINDNAPEFNSSEYSVAITELAQVGFALPLFIQVQDKDEVRHPLLPLVLGRAGEKSLRCL